MPEPIEKRTRTVRRWTLILGVAQILVGCLVGLLPPTVVPWFRGVVMAHVEFTGNGVLMIALGLLVPDLRLGRRAWSAWIVSVQSGTWLNGGAALAAGLRGRTSPFLAFAQRTSPPPDGSGDPLVSGMLIATAIAMIAALTLTLVGLLSDRGNNR